MKYSFESRVRYSECGRDGHLTIPALVNYFQDTATFQSEDLGIGHAYLTPEHKAWVLVFWQLLIGRMPALNEPITTTTWPYDFEKFYGYRNFTLTGAGDECFVRANSVWVMMDMQRQRPARVDEYMIGRYEAEPKLEMDYAPRRFSIPEGGRTEEPFEISPAHLDTNGHVNNGKYVELAYAYLPGGLKVKEVLVEYRKQAFLKDTIVPRICETEEKLTVALEKESGEICCAMQVKIDK